LVLPIKAKKYNQFVTVFNEKLERAKYRRKIKFENVEHCLKIECESGILKDSGTLTELKQDSFGKIKTPLPTKEDA